MKLLMRILMILYSFIGLWLKFLILRNCFHGLESLFHLSQVLGSDLINMTELIICWIFIVFLRRKKLRNGFHILRTMQIILMKIILQLLERMFERKFIEKIFNLKKLRKKLMLRFSCLFILIGVFLNEKDEFTDHVSLRPIKVLMLLFRVSILIGKVIATVFIVVRVIFSQICIHPYFNFPSPCYEYHFFHNIKISHFLIQYFKSVKSCLVHVQKVIKRNVIYLLQT